MIDVFKKKENIKNVFITYIPATIISCIYPIYLYLKTGKLFSFVEVEYTYWGRIKTNLFRIWYDAIIHLIHDFDILYLLEYIIIAFLIGYLIYLIMKNIKNKNYYDLYTYMIFTILIICSSIRNNGESFASFYRYLFGCFPIYFILPKSKYTTVLINDFSFLVAIFFLQNIYFY